jgi:DUF1680 family protein
MMKKLLLLFALMIACKVFAQKKDYPIQNVPFTQVHLSDNFWLPRIRINQMVTIPASFERCEKTGRVNNFVMAAARSGKFCTIYPFDDTDIYKTLEGASYSLSLFPDPKLEAYMDSLIAIVAKAQEPDGYLYTARTIDPQHPHEWSGDKRWMNERKLSHELYNSGHLFEAAAAHYQATGKRNLLNIALKNADLVCSVFGPAPNQEHTAPGHEVVEMGLVKLYRITGKQEYLNTAKYFVEERGRDVSYDSTSKDEWKNGSYWQDNIPVTQQTEAIGHAVRAGYLYSAVADVAALTGDTALLHAVDTIWQNVVGKKMYVQGGVGAIGAGERFGDNYELPNATAYNETCAAIAQVFWNQRMFLLHGDSKYIDVLEKVLYNGFISGVGLDGKSFFYTNAMQIKNSFSHPSMEATRSGWFPCSCCPTNVVRLMPAIPGYVYAVQNDKLYANLFIAGTSSININGKEVGIVQQNNYPWQGDLSFTMNPSTTTSFCFLVRIPGWAQNEAIPSDLYSFQNSSADKITITVNGQPVDYSMQKGYAVLARKWNKGDIVKINLPMSVRRVVANDSVKTDINKVSLQRGPLTYCAEWPDNNGKTSNIIMPENVSFTTADHPELLNGVTTISGTVPVVMLDATSNRVTTEEKSFTAIPYYAWANRGKGEMIIWFPEKVKDIDLIASE